MVTVEPTLALWPVPAIAVPITVAVAVARPVAIAVLARGGLDGLGCGGGRDRDGRDGLDDLADRDDLGGSRRCGVCGCLEAVARPIAVAIEPALAAVTVKPALATVLAIAIEPTLAIAAWTVAALAIAART
ncbi:MAG TPA: hypothetical protein VHW23_04385, partial [Kofleriaceae bacterium]|nr:hypothetical protein [Kofleriaceae bacterium]